MAYFLISESLADKSLKLLLFFYAPLIEEGSNIGGERTGREVVLRCVQREAFDCSVGTCLPLLRYLLQCS